MKRVVLVLLGLVLMAGVLEALSYLALLLRPTGNPLAFPAREASLHLYRPSDGWLFYDVKPNHAQRFRLDEFDTSIRTNNVGWREDRDFDGEADVAFVGDSFTFGHGVEAGERYSDRVRQRLPDKRVWSYAYPNGYAPPHYLLYLRNNPQFVPKTLVVGLFPWNDLGRDIADMIVERDAGGAMVAIRSRSQRVGADGFLVRGDSQEREPGWRHLLREFHFGRLFLLARYRLMRPAQPGTTARAAAASPSSEGYAVDRGEFDANARFSLDALLDIASLVRARGGDVVVFFIPTSYMVGRYPYFCETLDGYDAARCARFREENLLGLALQSWAQAQCIALIDPTPAFRAREQQGTRLYFAKDGHWTPAGHQAAADLVIDYLTRAPAVPACPDPSPR